MGLFSKRQRITAGNLATEVAELVLSDAPGERESIDTHLRAVGFVPPTDGNRYLAELLIVAVFPYELILAIEHGNAATPVRTRVRELLLKRVNSARAASGDQPLPFAEWQAKVDARLDQYANALQSGVEEQGVEIFAARASTIICGSDAPDLGVAALVRLKYAGTMQYMRPPLKNYLIVP